MRCDLTSLEVFVAVAEEANLTRAAERVHLVVSAVSKRIAELEELFGTSLLMRQPRGVTLTPAGQSLLHYAHQVLQLVDRMQGDLGAYAEGIKGHVRIHSNTSALVQFLPSELETFLKRYPMINLEIEERVGAAIVRAVLEGSADLGILGTQTPLRGLNSIPYHRDRLAIGVSVDHPLSERAVANFGEVLDYPIVGPHVDSSLWSLMADVAAGYGKPINQRIQVSSFDCMCRLVEVQLGVALLPVGVLKPFADAGCLRIVQLTDEWADRQLLIVVRDLDALSYPARTLIEHLRSYC